MTDGGPPSADGRRASFCAAGLLPRRVVAERVAWSAAKPMAMNGSTIENYRIMAIPFQGLTMLPANDFPTHRSMRKERT